MSVNQVLLASDGVPALVPDEKLLRSHDHVSLEVTCGDGYPGEPGSYYSQDGSLYLTTSRVIYLPPPHLRTHRFHSFMMPLGLISGLSVSSSWFSSPTISGTVTPVPYGGLSRTATFRIIIERTHAQSLYQQMKSGIDTANGIIAQAGPEFLSYLEATTPPTLPAPTAASTSTSPSIPTHPDVIMIPSFDFHDDLRQVSQDKEDSSPPPPSYEKTIPSIEMDALSRQRGAPSATSLIRTATGPCPADHLEEKHQQDDAKQPETLRRRNHRMIGTGMNAAHEPLLEDL